MLPKLLQFYRKSNGKTKERILRCIFSEKIYFSENKDATISFTTPIQVLINASKDLEGRKKEKEVKNDLFSIIAPLTDERCSYNTMIEFVTIRN